MLCFAWLCCCSRLSRRVRRLFEQVQLIEVIDGNTFRANLPVPCLFFVTLCLFVFGALVRLSLHPRKDASVGAAKGGARRRKKRKHEPFDAYDGWANIVERLH